jgi:N-acetylmuramoyl-L-alanine amidase/Bacterial SH3 domain
MLRECGNLEGKMQQQGKFMVFDLGEFSAWLNAQTVKRAIKLIQNHHTYMPSYKDFNGSNYFERLKTMEESHLQRGFSEIAQNLTTFPDGKVAVCRAFETAPAGIKGANSHGLCIENLGDFDAGQDQMTPAHRNTILKLNALLCQKFKLTPNTDSIVYHHWFDLETGQRTNGTGTAKSCPGTGFFGGNTVSSSQANFIPLIAQELANLSSAGAEALYSAEVTASVLNVRSQPSTAGDILSTLQNGATVQVYEEQGGWRRIDPSDSRWVNGTYLQKADAATT